MAIRSSSPDRPVTARPLLITADPGLLDDLLRIAGRAHVTIDVAPDPIAARPWFGRAPLVMVGADAAAGCVRAGLRLRGDCILVAQDATAPAPDWSIADQLGVGHLATLPAAEPWLVEKLTEVRRGPDRSGVVIAVLGGRGGAGASVLSAGLAVTAARAGRRTLLVDADPLGGGLDLVLGWEGLQGLRWPDVSTETAPLSPPKLVDGLPRQGELVMLSWDRHDPANGRSVPAPAAVPADAMAATLDAGRRGRDVVVVDLARCLDEACLVALAQADRGLLVVPAELRACAAAARMATLARAHCPGLAAVVRGPAPGGLRARDVAQAVGLPLAGAVRAEPGLAAALERGEPPAGHGRGPLAALCRRLLADVSVTSLEAAA